MTHPVIAAQLYTVRQFCQTAPELAASLEKIRAIGYRAVQVSGIGKIPDAEVKQMVDAQGLTICNTHVRPTDALWNDLPTVVAQHKLWNCKNVAIGSMPHTFRDEGEAGFRRFAKEASEIGARLFDEGLTFSYHNHSFEFIRFGKRTGLDIIYEESDPRHLRAEIDTYWVQFGGSDPAMWIKKMSGRMPVVHFKDMVMLNNQQTMAEIGEGNLNWAAILPACEEAGVEWCAVEQDICQRDPFESLKISYQNLRQMGLE